MAEVNPENGPCNAVRLKKIMDIYVILLEIVKRINCTEMGFFQMDMLQQAIDKFKLNVLAVENVPESFSSTVYKIKLIDHRTVYI